MERMWRGPQCPPRLPPSIFWRLVLTPLFNGSNAGINQGVPGFCVSGSLGSISWAIGSPPGCPRGAGAGAERVPPSPAQQNGAVGAGAAQRVSTSAPFQPNSWRATVLPAPHPFKPSIKSVINSKNTLHPCPAAAKAPSQQVLTRPHPAGRLGLEVSCESADSSDIAPLVGQAEEEKGSWPSRDSANNLPCPHIPLPHNPDPCSLLNPPTNTSYLALCSWEVQTEELHKSPSI